MQEVPIVALLIKTDLRLPRLMEEYSKFPAELLIESILKISRRLGGDRSREAVKSIESGNISRAIEIVLFYYDKAYLFGLKQKDTKSIIYVDTDTDDIEINASKVLEAAGGINWDCFPAP
jgi:tRNA 2-selenouridine synthase